VKKEFADLMDADEKGRFKRSIVKTLDPTNTTSTSQSILYSSSSLLQNVSSLGPSAEAMDRVLLQFQFFSTKELSPNT